MSNHKLLLVMCASVIIMSACSESVDRRIVLADSLSWSRPDSAMMIMDSIEPTKQSFSKGELMRYELIRAKVQNRAYIDFTTDSVMKEVADYYDHHGSANDRMMAHYLLGCTYRDLKEAPMALKYYLEAVEKADTSDKECDFLTLMSIYGQISNVYHHQAMPEKSIDALEAYSKYAKKAKNIYESIRGLELEMQDYSMLQDTATMFLLIDSITKLYKENGLEKAAANSLCTIIPIYLTQNRLDEAKKMMDIFESKSGEFDVNGSITARRERYYYTKGWYYNKLCQFDSAEYYYRKLLNYDYKFDACRGLLSIYKQQKLADSIISIMPKYEDEFNKLITHYNQRDLLQTQAMYDYNRNAQIAREKEIDALKKTNMLLISVVVLVVLGVCAYFLIRRVKRQKRHIAELAEHTESLENECESKEGEIGNLQKELDLARQYMMQTFSSNVTTDRIITPENWETIRLYLNLIYNNFTTRLHLEFPHLTEEDIKYCMLIKMGFSTQTLAQIYGIAEKSVKQKSYMFKEKLGINESDVSLRQFLADF